MQKSVRSYIHVAIQFAAIFYFVIEFNWIQEPIFAALILAGVTIGLWAIWIMRRSVFSVFPEPNNESSLLNSGPYRVIRHPMYTALFLVFIPIVIFQFNYFNLFIFIIFAINQILKINFEELLLLSKFTDYRSYREKTWRLFPFIF